MSAVDTYHAALVRIADAESGVWGQIANEALRAARLQALEVPAEDALGPDRRLAAELYEDAAGGWRWRVRAANGEIVASGESHTRAGDARRALEGVFPDLKPPDVAAALAQRQRERGEPS